MASLPRPIGDLIEQLKRLPGIGRRGAERIVTHLLESPGEQAGALAEAIGGLKAGIRACERCGAWASEATCDICADVRRDGELVCVVERSADIYAFEDSGAFEGRYHVLGGTLSPLGGVGPDDLKIRELAARIPGQGIREIIVATSPTVEGDATALYLSQQLEPLGVRVTRIGLGLPLGASLGYADAGTLRVALEGRRRLEG